METKSGPERDQELLDLADSCAALALKYEAQGKHQEAAHQWALATFFSDCIAARPRRFRGRATQRKR